MRIFRLLSALALAPALAVAQEPAPLTDPTAVAELLRGVLPEHMVTEVVQIVTDAINRGLPGEAVALRALEGVAKTRSGEAARDAARALVESLEASRDALQAGGRAPRPDEITAGAAALDLGVSGDAVSALAGAAPSGRSLAVPLTVLGALVGGGVPAGDALVAVTSRVAVGADDAELGALPGTAGDLLAGGMPIEEVGLALASGRAGFAVPTAGAPAGVPSGVPTNPGVPGDRPQPPTRGRP